jgi:YjjG family noncanonical pyrimidine nucleotidase
MEAKTLGMKEYKCIFFDLDHTLWDYETNSRNTLIELYEQHELKRKGVADCDSFHQHFQEVNLHLWDQYDRGLIDSHVIRSDRFKIILKNFRAFDQQLSDKLSSDYLSLCPTKGFLMPYALEVIQYLSEKYTLTIITNGFDEIQHIKMRSSNILSYFKYLITSQKAGCRKPAKQIFEHALALNNAQPSEAIMIGDNLVADIGGAKNAMIDCIYYNPLGFSHAETVNHEIKCLSELFSIL